MKTAAALLLILASITFIFSCKNKKPPTDDEAVKAVVDSFYYDLMTNDFKDISGYTTNDINYISQAGTWFKDRKQLQDSIEQIYKNVSKNAPVSIDTMTIRYVTKEVAIVNLVEKTAFYPIVIAKANNGPDGIKTARTMVLIKQNGKWLLTQNQSTMIEP